MKKSDPPRGFLAFSYTKENLPEAHTHTLSDTDTHRHTQTHTDTDRHTQTHTS